LNGTLYGVTLNGGPYTNPWGTIYSVNAQTGAGVLIYSFAGPGTPNNCGQLSDGGNPNTGLVPYTAANGSTVLYGTTTSGGANNWWGTIFSINSSGQECVAWSFGADIQATGDADGRDPNAGLIYDAQTKLFYGTTEMGGAPYAPYGQEPYGCGTIFAFDPTTSQEQTIYTFTGGSSGCGPLAALLLVNGILYGTTSGYSGDSSIPSTYGTVFGFNLTTKNMMLGNTKMNYAFQGGVSDGSYPQAQLVYDQAHNVLYGTTTYGGNGWASDYPTQSGYGTIFQVDLSNGGFSKSTIYKFTGGEDGQYPLTGLVYDGVSKYYTTTSNSPNAAEPGGVLLGGTLSPVSGVALHAFGAAGDGNTPNSLTFANGVLYGTTKLGGGGFGTVFEYVP
jgi:uncharacterized repeat protein (TIGR03803 family)